MIEAPRVNRLLGVQALRAIAAILVVGDHEPDYEHAVFGTSWLEPGSAFGNVGVDLFFVISGFIMVAITWSSGRCRGSPLAFLERRICRIYPLYWLMTLAYLVLHALHAHDVLPGAATLSDVVASLLLLPHRLVPVLPVAWTLQHEIVFYLIFAFMLTSARPSLVLGSWLAVIFASSVLREPDPLLAVVTSPLNIEFMAGTVVGALVAQRRITAPIAFLWIGVASAITAFGVTLSSHSSFPTGWTRALLFGPPMACVLYGVVGLEVRKPLHVPRVLVVLGDASYSLYLSHIMVLALVAALFVPFHRLGTLVHAAFIGASFGATLIAALALYATVERPLARNFEGRSRFEKAAISPRAA